MGTLASLSDAQVSVEPGQTVTVGVTIRNTGTVVDSFYVEVLGVAAPWATVEPPQLPLMPGAAGTVAVRLLPPRDARTPFGEVAFAVRVRSTEDPAGSAVEEGVLHVGRFADLSAELLPRARRARGRRAAKYEVAIDNRGNTPVNVALDVRDRDGRLDFTIAEPGVVVAPGTAQFCDMHASAKKGFWTGAPVTHVFQTLLEPADDPPIAVDGTFLQEARVPKWLPRAIAAAAALAVLLAIAWVALVKPSIRDTATNAANKAVQTPLAAAQSEISSLARHVGASPPPPLSSGSSTTPGASASPVGPYGNPADLTLSADASNPSPGYRFGAHQFFSLTDVVLQNPQGDAGQLQITRGSQILVQASLSDFRTLDLHMVAPVEFSASSIVTMHITCANPGSSPRPCTPAALLSGFSRSSPPGQ